MQFSLGLWSQVLLKSQLYLYMVNQWIWLVTWMFQIIIDPSPYQEKASASENKNKLIVAISNIPLTLVLAVNSVTIILVVDS